MSERWRADNQWRIDDPEVGQWVEVQHKGICQYLGPSDFTDHKYIDRNGTTHSIGNYGWRPLPATHEERRLLDLLRWRDAWGEPPTEHGEYLVHRYAFYGDSEIMTLHWNGSWPMRAITHWRPLGPLPGGCE